VNAPLPRDLGDDITTFVTVNPGTTRDHVADHFDIELDVAYTMLVDLVDLKQICSAITRQDGKTITVYRAPGAELPTIFEKALASAEVAAGGQPQTAEQKAIAFITANGGSATSDELAHVLGLKSGQYPSTWLADAIKNGRLNKNSRDWTLGIGAIPEQMKPLVFNRAISTRHDAEVEVPVFADAVPAVAEVSVAADQAQQSSDDAPVLVPQDNRMQVEWDVGDMKHIITAPTAEDIAYIKHLLSQPGPNGVVVPVDVQIGTEPVRIAEASFAIWSTGELYIADGGRTVAALSREQFAEMLAYLSVFDIARGKK